jgi:hypothetical protein
MSSSRARPEGIQRLLLSTVDPGVTVTQKIPLDNLFSLLACLLNPNLDARLDAKAALLHGTCTKPVPPPHDHCIVWWTRHGRTAGHRNALLAIGLFAR